VDAPGTAAGLSGHVVICNANSQVAQIVDLLRQATAPAPLPVVLVIPDEALWQAHPSWHPATSDQFHTVVGNPVEAAVLERAGIAGARAAIVLADPRQGDLADARSALVALAVEHQATAVRTVVELLQSSNRVHLVNTEVDDVVCVSEITEKLMAQSCVTPWVKNVFRHLLDTAPGTAQIYVTDLPPALAGASFRELAARAIDAQAPFTLTGFVRDAGADAAPQICLSPRAGAEPGKDTPLGAGDQIISLGCEAPRLEELAGEGE